MKKEKIILGILIVIVVIFVIVFVALFATLAVKTDNSGTIDAALNAKAATDKATVQAAVNLYIAKLASENKNNVKYVISPGSITNGSAYVTVGSKEYIIDASAIKIKLPDGEWFVDAVGVVTVK